MKRRGRLNEKQNNAIQTYSVKDILMQKLSPIELTDILMARAESVCDDLRENGLGEAAELLQTRLWKIYDDLLPLTASKATTKAQLEPVIDSMSDTIRILESLAAVSNQYQNLLRLLGKPQ